MFPLSGVSQSQFCWTRRMRCLSLSTCCSTKPSVSSGNMGEIWTSASDRSSLDRTALFPAETWKTLSSPLWLFCVTSAVPSSTWRTVCPLALSEAAFFARSFVTALSVAPQDT